MIHVNNQLDAQFFFLTCLFVILYVFWAAMCSSSGESIVSIRHLVYVTLCRWLSGMQVEMEPTQNDIYQMLYWYNWFSWWWAHGCSKHVENLNKYIRKKSFALSWLFARIMPRCRSTKHKKHKYKLYLVYFVLIFTIEQIMRI